MTLSAREPGWLCFSVFFSFFSFFFVFLFLLLFVCLFGCCFICLDSEGCRVFDMP